MDCAGGLLALLSFSVVEHNVVWIRFACGGPGGCRHYYFLGLALDLRSDRLYALVNDIPDVMGHSAQCGYSEGDVSSRQPLYQGGNA